MPHFFLYARKSSEDDDRQVASIPAQVAELRAHAESRGIVITRTFEESQSAKAPGRPVFDQMMREADRHPVAGVLCWKADRLARNALDGGRVIDALDRRRVAEIVTPGRTFRNTGDDKFMLNIEFGVSKKYVDDLSDNVKRGNRAVLASGRYPGIVPIGYLKEPTLDRTHGRGAGRTASDPERLPLVRELFRRFLTGTCSVKDLHAIARDELGLRTRGSRRHPAGPMSVTGLYLMLQNPFYMGVLRHGGDAYDGDHERVISREEFEAIQRILASHTTPRPKRHAFAYRGLLTCGHCGRGVTAEQHVKRSGLRFVYYRCTRRWRQPDVCPRPFLNEAQLEAAFTETLALLEIPERFARWAVNWVNDEARTAEVVAKTARATIEKELAAKQAELDRLTTLCVRGVLPEDDYVARKTALLAEKTELETRLSDPAAAGAAAVERLRETITAAVDAPRTFREGNAEERRAFIATICEKIELRTDGVCVELAKPFAILAGTENAESAPKGANPAPDARRGPRIKVARVVTTSRATREGSRICPVGANPTATSDSPLNQRKSRARRAAGSMTFLAWCTRVNDVRTYLASLNRG